MSEKELNQIIAENLTRLMYEQHKTQKELIRFMGVSQSTASYWMSGAKTPRMNKIDKLCEFLNCSRSDLLYKQTDNERYYTDENISAIAERYRTQEGFRVLCDASRGISDDKLKALAELLKGMS